MNYRIKFDILGTMFLSVLLARSASAHQQARKPVKSPAAPALTVAYKSSSSVQPVLYVDQPSLHRGFRGTYETEVSTAGRVVVKLDESSLAADGKKTLERLTSTYNATGFPLQDVKTVETADSVTTETLTYGKDEVKMTTSGNGPTKNESYALPEGVQLANPSVHWFRTVTPKRGAEISFRAFDTGTKKWVAQRRRYEGLCDFRIGSSHFKFYLVRVNSGNSESGRLYDAKGRYVASLTWAKQGRKTSEWVLDTDDFVADDVVEASKGTITSYETPAVLWFSSGSLVEEFPYGFEGDSSGVLLRASKDEGGFQLYADARPHAGAVVRESPQRTLSKVVETRGSVRMTEDSSERLPIIENPVLIQVRSVYSVPNKDSAMGKFYGEGRKQLDKFTELYSDTLTIAGLAYDDSSFSLLVSFAVPGHLTITWGGEGRADNSNVEYVTLTPRIEIKALV